jgi:predicted phage terminase large subunit-like protein
MQFLSDADALAAQIEAFEDLHFFSKYMFKMRRGYRWLDNWHHKVICDALMRVYRGECKRLLICIPPRYSKTELAVINFIAWSIGRNPDAEFIHTSYSTPLAHKNSFDALQICSMPEYNAVFPGLRLTKNRRARGDWATSAGGVVYAQGAGGTITGFGAGKLREGFGGAIIFDDIHKADEARSDTVREGVIEWFQNTLESRTNSPHTPIIGIGQRLHERDLPGWLIAGGNGEKWEVVNIRAIAEEDDPYGRTLGEALWQAKHDIEALRRLEATKPYEFSGQYQQRPSPRSGGLFEKHWFEVVDAAPANERRVRKWDLAGTVPKIGSDPDWTVGLLMSKDKVGIHYIEDIVRFRGSPRDVEQSIINTAAQDGTRTTVGLAQDPGQAGKFQVEHLIRNLAGFTVRSAPETGSKEIRAMPLSAQAEAGNVKLVKAPWNEAFLNELSMFPNATHDDQVDAASGAFEVLTNGTDAQAWVDMLGARAAEANARKPQ